MGDYDMEIFSFLVFFVLTDSKTLAKVGCPFCFADVLNLKPLPVRMVTLNLITVYAQHVKNTCNNFLRGLSVTTINQSISEIL